MSSRSAGKQFHVVGPACRRTLDSRTWTGWYGGSSPRWADRRCRRPATHDIGRQSDVKYPGDTHFYPNSVVDVQPVERLVGTDSALDRTSECWRRFKPQHWGHAAACRWLLGAPINRLPQSTRLVTNAWTSVAAESVSRERRIGYGAVVEALGSDSGDEVEFLSHSLGELVTYAIILSSLESS